MKKFINDIIVALKGFGMGAANVIPGVSGGTIALLTGIFGRLIDCLNALMVVENWKLLLKGKIADFWKKIDGRFLAALAVGVLISVFSLAKLMEYVLQYHPIQTWAFFFGLIVASAAYMLADIKKWKAVDVLWAVIGAALGLIVCTLSPTQTPDSLWFVLICGAIAICTMILPGISGSFILVILGKYEYIMNAVSNLDIPVLGVFAVGCIVGILAFAKLLHWLLARCERQTMLVLVGFVIGSLVKVWPWSNMEAVKAAQILRTGSADPIAMQIPSAIIWAILGVALVIALELLGSKAGSTSCEEK